MSLISKHIPSVAAVALASLALVTLSSTASVAAAPDVFSVTTLTTNNAVFVDSDPLTGDDDGFVGVTGTKFLTSGDNATVAYDLADMGNPYTTNLTVDQNNWLFSDVKTQTSYVFEYNQAGVLPTYDITGFQPLNQTGDVAGAVVPLSATVTIDNTTNDCTIFASGYGRVAIWDGCLGVIYDIALPSGVVTTVTGVATFANYDATRPVLTDYYETDNNVSQAAIAEFDGAALHIVAVAANAVNIPEGIFRYDVQNAAAAPTQILSFGGVPVDMYELTVSPATGQWCSHAESGWAAISAANESELAFCASATFAVPAAPAPAAPAAPALAATGVDTAASLAVGGLVLLLGFGLIVFARRRHTA